MHSLKIARNCEHPFAIRDAVAFRQFRYFQIYHEKPILYGCGDFLNDYEGISGHDEYRSELTLMYFPVVNRTDGKLVELTAVPLEVIFTVSCIQLSLWFCAIRFETSDLTTLPMKMRAGFTAC